MNVSNTHLTGVMAVFACGVAASLLGALKLRLCEDRGWSNRDWGTVTALFNYAQLPGALCAGPLTDRIGHRIMLSVGFLLMGAALLLAGRVVRFGLFLLAVGTMALAYSCLNVAGNLLLARFIPGDAAAGASLGNVFFGLGALITPAVVAVLLARGVGLQTVGLVFALSVFWPVLPAVVAKYEIVDPHAGADALHTGIPALLREPNIWLCGIGLVFYAGMEVGFAQWGTTYFRRLGWSTSTASCLLALFWIAFLVGRVMASQLGRLGWNLTESGGAILIAGSVMAGAVLAILLVFEWGWLVIPVSLAAGLLLAPMFPILLGRTLASVSTADQGAAFGLFFTIGISLYGFLTKWIGHLADTRSIRAGFSVVAWCCLGLAVTGAGMLWLR